MLVFRKIANILSLALLGNIVLLGTAVSASFLGRYFIGMVLFGYFVFFNILPRGSKAKAMKQQVLVGGYELLVSAGVCFVFEGALYLIICFVFTGKIATVLLVANAVVYTVVTLLVLLNAVIRIAVTSVQLSLALRILLLCLWWVPVANIVLFMMAGSVARAEYVFGVQQMERNLARWHKRICQTKYPLLLVHGIFFRDWKAFNYWGRIPEQLLANGAVIHYGNQPSSASVETSAEALRQRIGKILAETDSEKVNIIAHSKGGLDARYAISCLGMAAQVASLTTVNTPHRGCTFAGKALERAPDKLVSFINQNYNLLFQKLGDDTPDFFSGVSELTVEKCARLNAQMPDAPEVYYQSVGSKMKSASSAAFPLNIGYKIVEAIDGENDGLVFTESMPWGNFLGILAPKGRKGISHGDMIDLTRKNVKGFDVGEYYVELVAGLKQMGL